jgi:hypothetical protein
MNHTIKAIIIVAAITSILVVGINMMIPLAQNTYASSHRHSEFKNQDNILNQQDDTYTSPGSQSSNIAIQESGKGNSPTAFSDQSSNLLQQQQNQPTSSQQQNPQANNDKDNKFPITLNVLPDHSSSSTSPSTTTNTKSTPPLPDPELVRLEHQPDTTNYPAVIASMKAAAAKDGAILPSSACDSHLNSFIKPLKEQRFTIIADCVKVAGILTWTNYFNEDGDANFNLILDPQYAGMLGPGNYGRVFETKYNTIGAIHVEIPCQGPVTSTNVALNVGACDGYDSFKLSKTQLPKEGDHVMVTGRYLIEIPEMPGGITEIHPVTRVQILPS